jgi:hypothetical protein
MYSGVCVYAEMQNMFKDKRVKKCGSVVEVKKDRCLFVRVWHMSSAGRLGFCCPQTEAKWRSHRLDHVEIR